MSFISHWRLFRLDSMDADIRYCWEAVDHFVEEGDEVKETEWIEKAQVAQRKRDEYARVHGVSRVRV